MNAAEYCQLEVLEWLKTNNYRLTSDEFDTFEQDLLDLGDPEIEVDLILKFGDEDDSIPIYNWIHENVRSIHHPCAT